MIIQYNDVNFRALFPPYADATAYPLSLIQLYWGSATAYISNCYGGYYVGNWSLPQQTLALNYMTAHLIYIAGVIASGQVPGIVTSAGIDKITVEIEPPPETNQWQYWLQTSPYGQQLLALLQVASAGGLFASTNLPARAGFSW